VSGMILPAVIGYFVALLTFTAIDLTWLGIMAPRFYKTTLGDIALADVNVPAAVTFYLLYPVGLVIFAIEPALRSGNVGTALIYGALFGFFTYATYDLTNQATLRNWTVMLTVVDVAWGTTLGAISSAASYVLVSRLLSIH
jgi:uncharacterized membrane protein